MAQTTLPTDLRVQGNLACTTFTPPAGCITNTAVVAGAGVEYTKLVHYFPARYQTATGTAVTAATHPIHIARGAGTIVAVKAYCTVAPTGGDNVTIDVQKGNQSTAFATVLSSTVVLNSSDVNRQVNDGTLSTTTYAANDEFQAVVTVSGTTGQGLCVVLYLAEEPA